MIGDPPDPQAFPVPRYFRPTAVARHLSVSRTILYEWIKSGELPAVKMFRTLRIREDDLIAFCRKREREGGRA